MELRPYQAEAVEAVYKHLRERDDNPCVVIPTAGGKSVIIGKIASDSVIKWGGRVLLLAHVKELLEQNAGKIKQLCPDLKVGIYSAGLKSRDTDDNIIVAGIQSVYNKACELGSFDLVITDECHMIPDDGMGMYHSFLQDMKVINPNVRLVGFTATPYRLKGGLICKSDNMLNYVCYEVGIRDMIEAGYLSKLTSKAGKTEAKLNNLHMRAGEFIQSEVDTAMNNKLIVQSACREIVDLTADRKTVLIFCTSIEHCKNVAKAITVFSGEECAIVTGSTADGERADIIARMRGERVQKDLFGGFEKPLKYVANVGVLTTGVDVPNIDCVVLLRPTASPGLLVQMVGRGLRLSPQTGKKDCLVLDYGENILRHGPIDKITVKEHSKKRADGEAPAKKCPKCLALIHASIEICPDCGYEFPPQEIKHTTTASSASILSGEIRYDEFDVSEVFYNVHTKRGADPSLPKTVRVDYRVGFNEWKSEWVCPEHEGYVRKKFDVWWKQRAPLDYPPPSTAQRVVELAKSGILRDVEHITVKQVVGEQFDKIICFKFGERKNVRRKMMGDDSEEIPDELFANYDSTEDIDFVDDVPF